MTDNKPNPRGKPMTNKQSLALLEAIQIIVELSDSKDSINHHIERIKDALKEKTAHSAHCERSEQTG